ncbi:MAG TPA: transporter substrate-binding domain-containing protein [Syntrophales bacterium]|nr:transporter substrate-binding domain-containing protein [Syntrophales bacterium]HQB30177.1 transporter substrate-binding domain-containing protein [Syntrophales bacterium]HQN78589.1 transporter substrate-binding domain-containing protein [Syntrophales bacterium]HQQ27601.1 transporter substrate-binding domain-containing protein [Syntrophales bacterium]
MKKTVLLICLVLLALAGCTEKKDSAVLRAAVCPTSPPNLFLEDGKYRGLDLELFEGYCQARNRQFKIAAYDWQGMLDALVAGRADVAFSAISITDERKGKMDFSRPYMDNTWNLVSLRSRNIRITDLADLKRYTIGYPHGMAYSGFIANELEPRGIYRLDDVKTYPTYNEVIADLQNGNLDLAFLDGTVAAVYKKKIAVQDSYVFTGFDTFGFAFPKGSPLRADFDRYLDELGPEKLGAVIGKWME